MNQPPKELEGRELLKHAAELYEAYVVGEKIEMWIPDDNEWDRFDKLIFGQPFWRYRVAPKKIVRYVNIYPDGTHESRQAADRRASSCRLACVRIEYHEGQYDE